MSANWDTNTFSVREDFAAVRVADSQCLGPSGFPDFRPPISEASSPCECLVAALMPSPEDCVSCLSELVPVVFEQMQVPHETVFTTPGIVLDTVVGRETEYCPVYDLQQSVEYDHSSLSYTNRTIASGQDVHNIVRVAAVESYSSSLGEQLDLGPEEALPNLGNYPLSSASVLADIDLSVSSFNSEQGQPGFEEESSITFIYNGNLGVPIHLALEWNFRVALLGLSNAEDRRFFEGFGEKASYEILLEGAQPFRKQKRCRRVKHNAYFYVDRLDIVRQVAEVMRDFLHSTLATSMPMIAIGERAPGRVGIVQLDELVLLELVKVSRATVRPILGYRQEAEDLNEHKPTVVSVADCKREDKTVVLFSKSTVLGDYEACTESQRDLCPRLDESDAGHGQAQPLVVLIDHYYLHLLLPDDMYEDNIPFELRVFWTYPKTAIRSCHAFLSFVQLVQAIAAIKPKAFPPSRKAAISSSSNKHTPLCIFTNWVKELYRRYAPLPRGTASCIFRLLFPNTDVTRKYGMQEAKLSKHIIKILGVSAEKGGRGEGLARWTSEDADGQQRVGCLGAEVQKVIAGYRGSEEIPGAEQTLTLATVDMLLTGLARSYPFSAPSVLLPSSANVQLAIPMMPQPILCFLFAHPTLSPLGAAVVTQIILKDLRPLLYPLPDEAVSHYANALLNWKSNAVETLTVNQALGVWEVVAGWEGLAKAWKMKGWDAFDGFERAQGEEVKLCQNLADDCSQVDEEEEEDADEERISGTFTSAYMLSHPVVGMPVTIPKSVKATSCAHALRSISKHHPPSAIGAVWAETKYDGERAQIHVQRVSAGEGTGGGCWKITIYSKSGRDSTYDRAGIHGTILDALGLSLSDPEDKAGSVKNNVIVDAEMIAYSDTLGSVDEFWRIRSLIASTAVGPRRRTPRARCADKQQPSGSQGSDTQETDPGASEPDISLSQASMVSDHVCRRNTASCPHEPYKTRRAVLERLVHVREGCAMLAQRVCVGKAGSTGGRLRRAMAMCIANHEEGLVLKAEEGGYGDWRVPWVKLKKDYIPGYGDCVDLVLLGAGWDKDRARELRVGPSVYTTFYIGALVKEGQASGKNDKPLFEVLFSCAYGLSRDELEELNFLVRNSGEGYAECAGSKHSLSTLPYVYHVQGDISRPGPTIMLATPLLVEILGANFTKAPHSMYYTLRFPRIQKVHRPSERSWRDGLSLQELQRVARVAVGKDRPGKVEDDWCTELWGGIASPSVRAPERCRERKEEWLIKLERSDGLSPKSSGVKERQLKRKWEEREKDILTPMKLHRRVKSRNEAIQLASPQMCDKKREIAKHSRPANEQENAVKLLVEAPLKLPLRALGSVTNIFLEASLEKSAEVTTLPTPPEEKLASPKLNATYAAAPLLDQNIVMEVRDENLRDRASPSPRTTYQIMPAPPITTTTDHEALESRPDAVSTLAFGRAHTALGALLSCAVVWFANSDNAGKHSKWARNDIIVPPGNQVHTLDALLFACGWSVASSCTWAQCGIVFLDLDNGSPSSASTGVDRHLWTDTHFPLWALMEKRKALLADRVKLALSKPIWVFSISMLKTGEVEGLTRSDIERMAMCRLG
ncbi:hypothetical protein NM688_g1893 [Phlebia brevispora]|uniref:Uncharacterized protein n=1 Tax=Phlebia brevispora TaxID=194682 RepID=A0ACC1TA17_9APHY|nr:hypothetical protein NM688_g1893 [Phlebia brevispora]